MKPLLLTKHLTLLLMSAAMSSAAKAQLSFAPQVTYPTGIDPYGVAVGDFNNDGIQDLAVANEEGTVSILLGNGDGTFQPQVTYAAGNDPQSVAIGDFNGDGEQDLVVSNLFSNTISVLLGNGDGTFGTAVPYGTDLGAFATVGDFNGDGKQDIAALNYPVISDGVAYIFLGNGDGTFQPPVSYSVGFFPASIAIDDYNNDGKQDLAIADNSGSIIILLGNGDGTFQPQPAFTYGSNYRPMSLAAADFNGDSRPDIAAINYGQNNVSILLGNGDGTFQPQVAYATGANSQFVTTGDFNGDGIQDLVVANEDNNNIGILLGNSDGTFQPQVTFAVSITPGVIAPGDFNGDGKQDIAVTNSFNSANNTVGILLNATPFTTPVTLTSFTGALQHGLATLSWQSGVESNFKQYEVEANASNKGYAPVGVVAAMGSNHNYTFSTAQAEATASYRLKLVNADGSSHYSDVVTLSQNGSGGISVYPNPATTQLHVQAASSSRYQLVNLAGNTVQKGELQAGDNLLNITSLPAGMYMLHAGSEAYKVIVGK